MFWIVISLLLIAAILLLANPFYRSLKADKARQMQMLADEIKTIEVDVSNEVISEKEADAMRRSTGKRMLALQDTQDEAGALTGADRALFGGIAALVILGSFGLYAWLGSPSLLDTTGTPKREAMVDLESPIQQPAGRPETIESAVAQLEDHLASSPDDAEGWQMLGWSYFRMNRFVDAQKAYETALKITPENPETLSAYGETLTMVADRMVTDAALAVFTKALSLDPREPRSGFYSALAKDQRGDGAGALADWTAMLNSAPADAPWTSSLRAQVRELAGRLGAPIPDVAQEPEAKGPDAADIAAASQMSPAQRQEMIQGMLERLETRLAENPNDLAGWQQLIRSRMVLGQREAAATALATARAALSGDSAVLSQLNQFAQSEGLAQ
jgi:cytochrome c-type biogenesis protein CcmH